ncbi:hypothetical protein OG792_20445 [Micromonospora sp. NBC_01699]|uniref:hypothetical protein n=1 Tax=Micromonospora sp. NBC_01699 TaxID=2975984 RepID=UPI002E28D7AC|nr:hypothetical protein [Micromonospora sp. NBC_01699]
MTMIGPRAHRSVGRSLLVAVLAALMAIPLPGPAVADGDVGIFTPKDVYMMDYPGDAGFEPNTPGPPYWNSPDVKACPTPITCPVGISVPAYTTSYLIVSLRNPGPYATGTDVGTLRVYFTYAGGSAVWPVDWTSLGSMVLTIPAGVTTVVLPWTAAGPGLVSTLYRWVSPDDPMLYEGTNTYQNAQFNNNVVWKNFSVV